VVSRYLRPTPEDIVIDCSRWRFPVESAVASCGTSRIARYGIYIATNWLSSIGVKVDRWHFFSRGPWRKIRPDLFDHATGTAYEVKTGHPIFSSQNRRQVESYGYAISTKQVKFVIYLIVGFEERSGLSGFYRKALLENGFRLIFLM